MVKGKSEDTELGVPEAKTLLFNPLIRVDTYAAVYPIVMTGLKLNDCRTRSSRKLLLEVIADAPRP